MFKKILLIIISISLLAGSASASTSGLKSALDEFNYNLTVEWDQQDPAFYQNEVSKLQSFIKNENISNQELMTLAQELSADLGFTSEMNGIINTYAIQSMSSQELADHLIDRMGQSYKKGASWENENAVGLLVLIGVVVLVVCLANSLNASNQSTFVPPLMHVPNVY